MGIFGKKENENNSSSIEEYFELKNIEAQDILDEFEEKANVYPLLSKSSLFYHSQYLLKDIYYELTHLKKFELSEDEVKKTAEDYIEKMKSISSNFTKSNLQNDMKIKENIDNMKNFIKKNRKFFVIEPLFDYKDICIDFPTIYCFSYNLRYDATSDKLCFLALTNKSQNAEYMSISPCNCKIREMNQFDFGQYADIRFSSFKTINEESFLCDKYKKLYDMYMRDSQKSK